MSSLYVFMVIAPGKQEDRSAEVLLFYGLNLMSDAL